MEIIMVPVSSAVLERFTSRILLQALDYGSITKKGEALGYSQSGITNNLEPDLGLCLYLVGLVPGLTAYNDNEGVVYGG